MKRRTYIFLYVAGFLLAVTNGCTSSSIMRDAQANDRHFVGRFHATEVNLSNLGMSDIADHLNKGKQLPIRTVSFMLFYYDSDQLPAEPDGTRMINYPNHFSLAAYIPHGLCKWKKTELLSGSRTQFLAATPDQGENKVFIILSNKFQMDLGKPPPKNLHKPYVMEIILEDDRLKLVDTDYTFNQIFHNKELKATGEPAP